jgi:hypothetical protein
MPASAMSTNPLRAAVCEDCETAVALEEKSFNRWRKGLFRGGKSIQDWRKAVVGALSKAKAGDRLAGPGGGRLTAAQASRFHEVAQGLQATSGGYDRAGDLGALNSGSLPGLKAYGNAADYQSHQEPMWRFLDQKGLAAHGRWKSPAQASVIGAANPEDFDYIVVQGHANASASPGGPKFLAGQATIGVGADRRRPAYASSTCKHDAGGHAAEGSDPVRVGRSRWPWSRVGDGTSDGKKARTGVDSVVVGGPKRSWQGHHYPVSITADALKAAQKSSVYKDRGIKDAQSAFNAGAMGFLDFGAPGSTITRGKDPGLRPQGCNTPYAVLVRDKASRLSAGTVHLYDKNGYLGSYRANVGGFQDGTRGVEKGRYTLQPKREDGNYYKKGTPALTGKGRPAGSPSAGYPADTVLFHTSWGPKDSRACVTAAPDSVSLVRNLMMSSPNQSLPFTVIEP